MGGEGGGRGERKRKRERWITASVGSTENSPLPTPTPTRATHPRYCSIYHLSLVLAAEGIGHVRIVGGDKQSNQERAVAAFVSAGGAGWGGVWGWGWGYNGM